MNTLYFTCVNRTPITMCGVLHSENIKLYDGAACGLTMTAHSCYFAAS